MGTPKWIKPFFVVAGLYDGILGLLFVLIPYQLFKAASVPPPNHVGYVQFPALLLIVFAIMFFSIARNPLANRSLILYGILLKISYSGVVLFHWMSVNIPPLWVVFAYLDLGFLVLFIIARRSLGKQS